MRAWAGRSVAITATLLLGGSCGGANTASPSPPATAATSSSAQQATVVAPEAFALAPDGSIYVSDCEAHRIFRLGSDGTVEIVAGSGPEGFENGDFAGDGGPATEARLNCPGGLAVDEAGELFVADTINNRIRMIDTHGTITTVAGSGPVGLDQGGIGGTAGPPRRRGSSSQRRSRSMPEAISSSRITAMTRSVRSIRTAPSRRSRGSAWGASPATAAQPRRRRSTGRGTWRLTSGVT